MIIGVDEAGRGALAGPVVAGAVFYARDPALYPVLVTDSKKLSVVQRQKAYDWITKHCVWGVGLSSAQVIDKKGIKAANHAAMQMAVAECVKGMSDYANKKSPKSPLKRGLRDLKLMVDGRDQFVFDHPSEDIVGGDAKVWEIGAASIVAKVTRDRLMREADRNFPEFGFADHKGYGTELHRALLERGQYCEEHRKSYDPLKTFLLQGSLF